MPSRAPTPDMARRSNLPVSTRHSAHQRQSSLHLAAQIRSPPSPPRSPTPTDGSATEGSATEGRVTEVSATPAVSRNERWLAWQASLRDKKEQRTRVEEREERRESLEANEDERFSPVPWVMSPPVSPPAPSKFSSIPIKSPRIHNYVPPTSLHTSHPLTGSPAESCASDVPMSPIAASGRTSRLLPADEPLEEFHAIETAFIKSPYVIPDDLLSHKPKTAASETNETTTAPPAESTQEIDMLASDTTDVTLMDGSDRDSLVELVEGYSFEQESVKSSPFIDFTSPRVPVLNSTPPTPSPAVDDPCNDLTAPPITKPTQPNVGPILSATRKSLDTKNDEAPRVPTCHFHQAMPDAYAEPASTLTTTPSSEVPTLQRMPSIQRRGQEYLYQFLAKRKSSPPTTNATPTTTALNANPTTTTAIINPPPQPQPRVLCVSLLTLALWIILVLSLLANIILVAKVYELQIPQSPPPQKVNYKPVTPGVAGETLEIFKPQSYWWEYIIPIKSTTFEKSEPTPIGGNNGQTRGFTGKRLTFGRGGKRMAFASVEGKVFETFERTKVFIWGVLEQFMGR
jgi:hypothetical protein